MHSSRELPILVAAGGTGGDLFPVLAVVEQLRDLVIERWGKQLQPIFIGNPHRIEGRIIPARGYRFVPVPMRGYYGMRSLRTYSLLWRLPASIARVWQCASTYHPQLAFGAGTYLTLPLGLVSTWRKIPLVLLEINARPGKVNRLLSSYAEKILVGYPECCTAFPPAVRERVLVVGTPVRQELLKAYDTTTARAHFGLDPTRSVLLVLGGSLGARSINYALESLINPICQRGWQILWQTGEHYTPSTMCEGIVAVPFIEDMAVAYAAAELVISRAGGSTVAELSALAKPAILVPYPFAANREQELNAQLLAGRGGAVVLRDEELPRNLWGVLEPLLTNPSLRHAMAGALRASATPAATAAAARVLAEIVARSQ